MSGTPQSTLRAVSRLAALLAVTATWMAFALVTSLWRGWGLARRTVLGQRWARSVSRVVGLGVEVTGTPPPAGTVLVANHRSYTDIAAIMASVSCAFLAKREVTRWPLLGAAARMGGTVFVARHNAQSRSEALRRLAALLERGHSVVVFPEGTSTRGPTVLPFRPGVFRLAAREGFTVVPVAIDYRYSADAWVGDDTFVGHFVRRFGKPTTPVSVHFGPPCTHRRGEPLRRFAQEWIAGQLAARAARPVTSRPPALKGETRHAQDPVLSHRDAVVSRRQPA